MLRIIADDYGDIHSLIYGLLEANKKGCIWTEDEDLRSACLTVWAEKVQEAQAQGRVIGLDATRLPWPGK